MGNTDKQKKSSYLFPTFISMFCIGNLLGLAYLFHTQELLTLKLSQAKEINQQFQNELTSLNQQNQNLENLLKQNTQNAEKKLVLYQVESIIDNAKVQINQLSDVRNATKQLTFAKQLATKHQWSELQDSLESDLQTLKQVEMTSPEVLIQTLSSLQIQLERNLKTQKNLVTRQSPMPAPTKWQKTLAPFIQISRYQQPYEKVVTPNDTQAVLMNALSLIPQLQYAGIHHQEKVYQALLQELSRLLNLTNQDSTTQELLSTLQTYHFRVNQPLEFQSTVLIAQMIESEKKS